MKKIVVALAMLTLSACADLSMYNQQPAPMGRAGEAEYPSSSTSRAYPFDDSPTPYSAPIDATVVPIGQNPAVIALLDSAYQQSESGQLDIAVAKLERAVRIAPKDGKVWHALAKVRQQQGKHALAISLAKKSNVLAVNDVKLQRDNWLLMAVVYKAMGNANLAQQASEKAGGLF